MSIVVSTIDDILIRWRVWRGTQQSDCGDGLRRGCRVVFLSGPAHLDAGAKPEQQGSGYFCWCEVGPTGVDKMFGVVEDVLVVGPQEDRNLPEGDGAPSALSTAALVGSLSFDQADKSAMELKPVSSATVQSIP